MLPNSNRLLVWQVAWIFPCVSPFLLKATIVKKLIELTAGEYYLLTSEFVSECTAASGTRPDLHATLKEQNRKRIALGIVRKGAAASYKLPQPATVGTQATPLRCSPCSLEHHKRDQAGKSSRSKVPLSWPLVASLFPVVRAHLGARANTHTHTSSWVSIELTPSTQVALCSRWQRRHVRAIRATTVAREPSEWSRMFTSQIRSFAFTFRASGWQFRRLGHVGELAKAPALKRKNNRPVGEEATRKGDLASHRGSAPGQVTHGAHCAQ